VDTHPEIERVQVEMLRKMSVAQRIKLTGEWSQAIKELAWRGIEKANPGASKSEIALMFLAVQYGQPLADRVRAYLDGRQSEHDSQTGI
jgi:hypothetical protein